MEHEDLSKDKLETKKNTVKIIMGVLRALIIINVIFYLVKLWAGQAVGPVILLPALICIPVGIFVYIIKQKLNRELQDRDNQ